ncbi:hypothetical protein [Sphingopyxis sp. GW247-27LB]|uniref:hypothetical protein n=1 Tax=Sphingopyxis sp. GW247-27LB TaxID=2012632 RepID=UPI000BA5195D|nr:hypothetical protein [Sphingopyxis sp. GW247-27LB]PAL23586.1 hypothetical protein CD928_05830 [Sphingopyxis sp. GW247-27LB]
MIRYYLTGLAAGVAVTLLAVSIAATPPIPKFIAHECDGAGGDLFAMDSSDFPAGCGLIERNR